MKAEPITIGPKSVQKSQKINRPADNVNKKDTKKGTKKDD